jgi:hypothetical protein
VQGFFCEEEGFHTIKASFPISKIKVARTKITLSEKGKIAYSEGRNVVQVGK